jgi:NTP pyrophosphatase (non-canonical NTP hydrolase)
VAPDVLVLRLFEEATELISPIHEAVRNWQKAAQNVINSLADILPLLCGLCNNIGINLDVAMEWKFGEHCPTCAQMPCKCPQQANVPRPEASDDLYVYPPSLTLVNRRTIDTWQNHLHEMYKDNQSLDVSVLPLKLLGDVGAISSTVRSKHNFRSDKDWKREIAWSAASVLAWTIAICNFFNDSKNTNLRLHDITFEKYASTYLPDKTAKEMQQLGKLRCPSCGHEWAIL